MNIIFMGTPAFAVPSLKILCNSYHNITAVVTVPDKAKGRGQRISESDIKRFAVLNELNILQPENLRDNSFIENLNELKPDLIVVVAFRILPKEVYSLPKYGAINLHASLLPKYRGAAPVNRAIMNGERETGVTTFFLKDKVDTGNIIQQNYCDINKDDDAGKLHDKLMELGALTVYSTVNLIEKTGGEPPVISQDNTEATPAPKIFKKDCLINWEKPAAEVYNFIRGLSPYPCSYTIINGKLLKIFKSSVTHRDTTNNKKTEKPGKFIIEDERILVCCVDEVLEIHELQPEGKKRMGPGDFLNGFRGLLK